MKNIKNNKKKVAKKKVCYLCAKGVLQVDYKDVELLQNYINYNGKIVPRRNTGCCNKHQRQIANAIKLARYLGLLPYIAE